jgi:hypothetical protein
VAVAAVEGKHVADGKAATDVAMEDEDKRGGLLEDRRDELSEAPCGAKAYAFFDVPLVLVASAGRSLDWDGQLGVQVFDKGGKLHLVEEAEQENGLQPRHRRHFVDVVANHLSSSQRKQWLRHV